MNSSHFMDKQIMGLAGSQKDEFFELLKPSDDQNGVKKDEILPSYDFQPIRPIATASSNVDSGVRVWPSVKANPWRPELFWRLMDLAMLLGNFLVVYGDVNYVSLETGDPMKAPQDRDKEVSNKALVSEIDRTMKKHADNLLQALESLSARLTQLESRTRQLEVSVDELKVSVGNHYGITDGRLRQLEHILKEVDTGVQVLMDKQVIAEEQAQLAKLQLPKTETQAPETPKPAQVETFTPPPAAAPLAPQTIQAPPPPLPLPALPPPANTLPVPNAPPPPPHPQQHPPPAQIAPPPPSQPPYYMPPQAPQPEPPHPQYHVPSQPQDLPSQQYQLSPQQSGQPAQHYQMTPQIMQAPPPGGNPLPPYPPQPQQQPPPPPPVNPPSLSQHAEGTAPYMPPSQPYPPASAARQQPMMAPPPNAPAGPQPFYGPSHMYEPPPPSKSGSQGPYPSGYGPPSGPNVGNSYGFSGSPSRYDCPPMKTSQLPPAPSSGNTGYPRLPTAQVLPQALPTASSVGSGSNSGSGRVPVDDVVERVAGMGFSRDQVRATVRRLTENGQSVDLNVVLDKLMNDGEIQPQKGWFGRS